MDQFANNLTLLFTSIPSVLYGISFFIGLLIGSFLNVVIYRMPVMMEREWSAQCDELKGETPSPAEEPFNLVVPGSRCGQCQHRIRFWENIPVISYLILRGRCSNCKTPISIQYPILELVTATLSTWVVMHFGFSIESLAALFLTWALIALSVIDFKHTLLPDDITLPFLWLGLILSIPGIFVNPVDAIIGGAAGYLSLWSVFQLFKLVTGKEGMGYGDFKLLAMLGAWLGWQALSAIIILSSFVGAIVGISLIIFMGRDRQIPIPFGPYLAIAGWIYLLYGQTIMSFYWALGT